MGLDVMGCAHDVHIRISTTYVLHIGLLGLWGSACSGCSGYGLHTTSSITRRVLYGAQGRPGPCYS